MGDRFRHAGHVKRMALLFAVGIAALLVARWMLTPKDFGVYGFYRAGALTDVRARHISYAGRAACEECHAGTYDPPDPPPGAKAIVAKADGARPATENKHSILRCEACHGPLAAHADDPEKAVPKVGADRLCLTCHREVPGRPASQPQVVPGDHGDNDPCVSCHKPHRPRTDEDEK
jgi:hypothetical protein